MKLFLFVLSCTFFSVQTKLTVKKNIKLIREGDPFTLVCDKPSTKWEHNGKIVAHCENCPSFNCNIHDDYKERVTAFCSKTESMIYFNSTLIDDDFSSIKCRESDFLDFYLRIGRYNAHLRSENNSTYALNQRNYTLVCDKNKYGYIDWYNEQGERLSTFSPNCIDRYSNYDTERFNITCDKRNERTKLHIKNVTLQDDGSIFGCFSRWRPLYLYQITVNVPVTSVSIQRQSEVLVENEDGIFLCIVEESKPEASFQWVIFYQNKSSRQIQQNYTNLSKTLEGKLWQTNSTLKLKLNRNYERIMCKSTIKDLPWTNSEYLPLDIKYTEIPTDPTVPDGNIPTDPTVPDGNIPTDSTIDIAFYMISVFVILLLLIIIRGGIACIKRQGPSEKNGNNLPANNLGSSEEYESTEEAEYASIYDVPRRSGHCDSLYEIPVSSGPALTRESYYESFSDVPRSSGQPTENEIPYDDAMDVPFNESCNYENQHFYVDIISTPTRTDFIDYEDLGD